MEGDFVMPVSQNDYEFIKNKIAMLKETYPSLRNKEDSYVFSALAVKSNFYKNPAIVFNESYFDDFIVDGQYDCGVDVLLNDPSSESANLIIVQVRT